MDNKLYKNLLMIAYHFPPQGGSAALRPLKLAKYLPSFGWLPNILTVKNPDWYYACDPDLQNELSSRMKIKTALMFKSLWICGLMNPFRIKKIDVFLKRFFIHPDDQIGWLPFAYFCALNSIKKGKIDAIYSTSGPITCHLIGYFLRRKTGLPWVAEFRDEWFEAPNIEKPTRLHEKLHYELEALIVKNADKIVTMAPVFNKLLSKHSNETNKFITITGGFDEDDMITEDSLNMTKTEKNKFIVSFIGLFYDTFRPNAFVKAICQLIDEGIIPPHQISIRFVGANSPNEINVHNKSNIFKFTGFVSRTKALQYLSSSNVLLLFLSKERGKDVIPSKIFEYLASKKPILAVVPPDGEVAKIVSKTRAGIVADFENVSEIKKAFFELYMTWKQRNDNQNESKEDEINKYNQKYITKRYANVLNELTI